MFGINVNKCRTTPARENDIGVNLKIYRSILIDQFFAYVMRAISY